MCSLTWGMPQSSMGLRQNAITIRIPDMRYSDGGKSSVTLDFVGQDRMKGSRQQSYAAASKSMKLRHMGASEGAHAMVVAQTGQVAMTTDSGAEVMFITSSYQAKPSKSTLISNCGHFKVYISSTVSSGGKLPVGNLFQSTEVNAMIMPTTISHGAVYRMPTPMTPIPMYTMVSLTATTRHTCHRQTGNRFPCHLFRESIHVQ